MERGYSRMDEEVHPQLLDLIPNERNWFVNRHGDHNMERTRNRHGHGGVADEKKLELRLGPPGVEDWSRSDAPRNQKSPPKPSVPAPNTSQKRTAPAPVVGWPPIRSFRKNLAGCSSAKPSPSPDSQNGVLSNKKIVKREKTVVNSQKGLFVKINMNGIPIGRKVDLNAYDSYEKLSIAVDELFRGLLAAQKDSCGGGISGKEDEENAITGLLDGSGEYTLVYEDNEGDRMLVGDVPWHMFVSAVKRLRVIRSCEVSNLRLGSKQEKNQV